MRRHPRPSPQPILGEEKVQEGVREPVSGKERQLGQALRFMGKGRWDGGKPGERGVQVKGMGSSSVGWQWKVIFFFYLLFFGQSISLS